MAGLYGGSVGLAVREGFPPHYSVAVLGSLSIGSRFSFDLRFSPSEIAFTIVRFDGRYVVAVRDDGPKEYRFIRSRLVYICYK